MKKFMILILSFSMIISLSSIAFSMQAQEGKEFGTAAVHDDREDGDIASLAAVMACVSVKDACVSVDGKQVGRDRAEKFFRLKSVVIFIQRADPESWSEENRIILSRLYEVLQEAKIVDPNGLFRTIDQIDPLIQALMKSADFSAQVHAESPVGVTASGASSAHEIVSLAHYGIPAFPHKEADLTNEDRLDLFVSSNKSLMFLTTVLLILLVRGLQLYHFID